MRKYDIRYTNYDQQHAVDGKTINFMWRHGSFDLNEALLELEAARAICAAKRAEGHNLTVEMVDARPPPRGGVQEVRKKNGLPWKAEE